MVDKNFSSGGPGMLSLKSHIEAFGTERLQQCDAWMCCETSRCMLQPLQEDFCDRGRPQSVLW